MIWYRIEDHFLERWREAVLVKDELDCFLKANSFTYWTFAIRIILRYFDCEFEYGLGVQAMMNEEHAVPNEARLVARNDVDVT